MTTRKTYFVVCNNLWILERYVCLLTLRKKANFRTKVDCLYKEYDFLQKFTIMSFIRFHFIILNSINYYIMYVVLYLKKNKHIFNLYSQEVCDEKFGTTNKSRRKCALLVSLIWSAQLLNINSKLFEIHMYVSMSWLQRSPASSIMFLESYGIWEGVGEHQFGAFENESLIFYMRCSVQRSFYACLISCDVCWIEE